MSMRQCQPRAERHNYRLACEGVKENGASPTVWIPAVAVNLEMPLPCLTLSRSTRVNGHRKTSSHQIAFMTQRCRGGLSPSRPRPPQRPHAHKGKGPANSRKINTSHVIPTLIPTLLINEGRAGCAWAQDQGPGSPTIPPSTGLSTLANINHICTMHHVQWSTLAYECSGLLFGTGQRIGCLAGSRNESKKQKSNEEDGGQGGNCPGLPGTTRLLCALPTLAELADEQGLDCPSLLAVVRVSPVSQYSVLTDLTKAPCSHIHTLGESQTLLDVKNTTLGLLVPDYRQGSDPVPCSWKDDPG